MAEANSLAPFELQIAVEAARYRQQKAEETSMIGGYLVLKAFMGRKTPRFKKLLGRQTADEFKAEALGMSTKNDPAVREAIRDLIRKVESTQPGHKKRGTDGR